MTMVEEASLYIYVCVCIDLGSALNLELAVRTLDTVLEAPPKNNIIVNCQKVSKNDCSAE